MKLINHEHKKEQTKISVITTSYPISTNSSSGIFVKNLIDNLPPDIHRTVIIPGSTNSIQFEAQPYENFKIFRYAPKKYQSLAHQPGGIPVALHQKKWPYLILPLFIVSLCYQCILAAFKSKLIHANWSAIGAIAGIIGKLFNTPVITTLRGEDISRASTSVLYSLALKLCIISNNKVICVSTKMKEILIGQYPTLRDKVVHIPNGVSSTFLNIQRNNKTISSQKLRLKLLTVGSLIPRKSINTIIEALATFPKFNRPFLNIIGDGIERENLEKLCISLDIRESVSFAGSISPNEIIEFYKSSDIFILSSLSEGRPNVLLEAMASELPVIASNIDGVIELIKGNGLLFEPKNHKELSNKISILLNDKKYRDILANKGKQFIINQHLTWNNTGSKYAKLYYATINE
ncbi:glycosyltransferase family 4 protein [Endozoicomonas sp. SM1973]|uniref:Glycosyltransferase family 4 protein n=1 Tax=Spartinivicinus marinus TaxID=2994442 RepID=A0A853I2G8_9GAMM|nr:glycosyltransferase family 4 protein [Spartinivicinus marinus]MCX4028337.1 glycosyltransferase family 4 protein [Spartinivicinus marinus]NYZ65672.1 glycosyltransferase family 4 protein [Spartinivicinus marinus]